VDTVIAGPAICDGTQTPADERHVSLNPEVAAQSMQDKTLEVALLPQGSLVEIIRLFEPPVFGTVRNRKDICGQRNTVWRTRNVPMYC